ncbi:MAG: DNA polymerase III subunit gamma/tau [Bacteroidota bacterium]
MNNFIVSARKYRPQTFDTVVGQGSITSTLKNAIKHGTLAQSFLFCGPRGVGKTTCARILAKTINCQNITASIEACDECPSCKSFNENASFNIHELDAASNNSVDDIRNLVDQVRIPPQVGDFKIYIIDEVHMLSTQAFNAFLKTLEEPPSYAKFILATTEKHKIIPTILSRCQIYDFKRISNDDIVKHLEYVANSEHVNYEAEALHIISQKSDGALRDALSMFDQIVSFSGGDISYKAVIDNLNVLDYEFYFKSVNLILRKNVPELLLTFNEIIERGFDGQHFINGLAAHFRNLLVCRNVSTAKLFESSESTRNRYIDQTNECSDAFLLKALEITNQCDLNYKNSNNKRLLVELSLLQLLSLLQAPNSSTASAPPVERPVEAPVSRPQTVVPRQEAQTSAVVEKSETVNSDPFHGKMPSVKARTISIRLPVQQNSTQANPLATESTATYPINSDPFSAETFSKTWDSYVQDCKNEPTLYSCLTTRKPILHDNNEVELILDNNIQFDFINEKRMHLIDFLRQSLKNDSINVKFTVEEKVIETKAYTSQDKFNKLAQINPNLIHFKNELNLDLSV